jgi:hypothetical protein
MDKYIGHDLEMQVKATQAKFLAEAEQDRLSRVVKLPQSNKTLPASRRLLGKALIKAGQWLAGPSEIQAV